MRPKTKRRLWIIGTAAVILVAVVTGWVVWRQSQLNNDLAGIRAEGLAAFKQADYITTLQKLKQYVGKKPDDAEALYAYAKARSQVTDVSGKHINEGILGYSRYLAMRPTDDVARHEQLELLIKAGNRNTEAIQTADDLLAKDKNDAPAIRAKAVALTNFRRYDDALVPARQYNDLRPADLEGFQLTFMLLRQLDRKPDEGFELAKKYREQHADDPRADVIEAFAHGLAFDHDRQHGAADLKKAVELLVKAAHRDPPDAQYVKALTEKLDAVGQYGEADALLKRAAAKNSDPEMTLLLVQRLWQNHKLEEVLEILKDLSPDSNKSDTQLLAYKALSLCGMKKTDDAKPIVDALAGRHDDSAAVGWSMALKTRFYDNPSPRAAIDQYAAALVRDNKNSVIQYLIGEAYASLGENELALASWRKVTEANPSWAGPQVRMAQILANTGRVAAARDAAESTYMQSPGDPTAAINVVLARFRTLDDNADAATVDDLLKRVTRIQELIPGEPQTLPIQVSLLVRRGKANEAKKIINDALASKQALPEEAYMRLYLVSRVESLGLEAAILDKSEKEHGLTTLLAKNRAAALYADGKTDEAMKFIVKAAADGKNTPPWEMSVAQFRDAVRDPGAKDAWKKLGQANPEDLEVQTGALEARATWEDRDFIKDTIERVRKLTGDEGLTWRIARARWLLGSNDKDRDTAEAISMLSEIVRNNDSLPRPHVLLALAMKKSGNSSAALEHLQKSASLNPGSAEIGIELVKAYQAMGKYDEAREQLNRVATLPSLTSDQATAIAYYFAQQHEDERGLNVLEAKADSSKDSNSETVIAELYRRIGRSNQAEAIYTKMLARPDVKPAAIISAADFYVVRGDLPQAQKILERLNEVKTEPGQKEMLLGTFNEQYISRDKALEYYRAATKANPADERTWTMLLGYYLRARRYDDLNAACNEAGAALPGSPVVDAFRRAGDVIKANGDRQSLGVLAAHISRDPTAGGVRDTLDVVDDITRIGLSPDQAAARLRQVSDRFPQFLPARLMLVQAYLNSNRTGEAIAVAVRTAKDFPTPESMQTAVNAFATAKRYEEMLAMADRWRKMTLEHPLLADLAKAEANMQLGRPEVAVTDLERYVGPGRTTPNAFVDPLLAYSRALIKAGRANDAAELLLPIAQKDAAWRGRWLALAAAHSKFADAKAWIDRITPSIATTAADEQILLAQAWYSAGLNFHEKEAFEKARDTLKPLITSGESRRPEVGVAYAFACEQLGDPASAENGYRAALKINPNIPDAQNNLAYILFNRGGDLAEAKDLATKAAASANAPATYFDTKARIYLKSGDRAGAIAAFEEGVKRDPRSPEAMIGLATALIQDGKPDKAAALLPKIEQQLAPDAGGSSLPPNLKSELEALRAAVKTSAQTDASRP